MILRELTNALQEAFPDADCKSRCERDISVKLSARMSLTVHLPDSFPAEPPVIKAAWGDGVKSVIGIDWHPGGDSTGQIVHVMRRIVSKKGPYRLAWGIETSTPLCEDAALARSARWNRLFTSAPTQPLLAYAISERVVPETAEVLARSSVLIIGLGSVGSYLAEQFGRLGVGQIMGIDDDLVEIHNLTRTIYSTSDIGLPKSVAMARKLARSRPDLKADFVNGDVTRLDGDELPRLFDQADLSLQRRINLPRKAESTLSPIGVSVLSYFLHSTWERKAEKSFSRFLALRPVTNARQAAGERSRRSNRSKQAAIRKIMDALPVNWRSSRHSSSDKRSPPEAFMRGEQICHRRRCTVITEALGRGHGMVMLGMEADYSVFPSLMGNAAGQSCFSIGLAQFSCAGGLSGLRG